MGADVASLYRGADKPILCSPFNRGFWSSAGIGVVNRLWLVTSFRDSIDPTAVRSPVRRVNVH